MVAITLAKQKKSFTEAWIAQLDPTMEIECVIQVTSSNPAGGVKE